MVAKMSHTYGKQLPEGTTAFQSIADAPGLTDDQLATLEAENRRLRDELDWLLRKIGDDQWFVALQRLIQRRPAS